ncbi:TRAF3-interacting JNK-activating modulator-like isoform X2 [Clupea harengus]|uniref:TRAF3-interacting JNK-activating modulator-like isoform X2 n=1 Tax=Clupea harengus TaxID=7950 RepID=A0A6P8FCI4_CLUHA|nr:TRAF3-interacting JNK-activating modulator-like isoform X2 [Clupea harengus]
MDTDNATKRQSPRTESYDQKLEHRAAKHECLRDRNNVTSCRSPGTPQESEWKSNMRRKRQREFQKRRQINSEASLPAPAKDTAPKEKLTLRGNRRKVPLIHRQSLVTSEDLGITWPDINALAQAAWTSSVDTGQEHHTGMTSSIPDTASSTATLKEGGSPQRRGVRTCEGVQTNQKSRHLSLSDFSSQTECGYVTIKEEDLIQLGEYLKEALWREEALKQKLALLQRDTSNLLLYCDKMWRACFKEDLMNCKIGALESQLQVCVQRFSKDEGKRLLMMMEEQFRLEEERTVACLQRITEEKTQAVERVFSLERALERVQEESNHWRQLHEEQGSACAQLRVSLHQSSDQIHSLQGQLESALHEKVLQENLLQLQDQYTSLHHHATSLEQDQPCAYNKDQNSSTAPVSISGHQSTDQAPCHGGRQNTMVVPELSTTDHNSHPGLRAPQQGTARNKRGMRCHILRAAFCLFVLILFLVAMTFLWFHHPMNKEELEKLYQIMENFAERCIQEVTSLEYPKCFRPI